MPGRRTVEASDVRGEVYALLAAEALDLVGARVDEAVLRALKRLCIFYTKE